jgi:hypothetical protein
VSATADPMPPQQAEAHTAAAPAAVEAVSSSSNAMSQATSPSGSSR